MWPKYINRFAQLDAQLAAFHKKAALPGIANKTARETLASQMIASLRRQDYTAALLKRPADPQRANPNSPLFDPERAAVFHYRNGNFDEAVWLIFLATHFGKHLHHGWRMLRDVYSGLGTNTWTWVRVTQNIAAFRAWLTANKNNIGGAFGNHRRYLSISGSSPNGTGAAIQSYVEWIGAHHSHATKFASLIQKSGNDPHVIFEAFFKDMKVQQFARLGKFDFLAMLGRLGFAPISPGKAYLQGATGPLRGAKLLFGGNPKSNLSAAKLESELAKLDQVLNVGMQVLEDSLCNWQKSPERFIHFRG